MKITLFMMGFVLCVYVALYFCSFQGYPMTHVTINDSGRMDKMIKIAANAAEIQSVYYVHNSRYIKNDDDTVDINGYNYGPMTLKCVRSRSVMIFDTIGRLNDIDLNYDDGVLVVNTNASYVNRMNWINRMDEWLRGLIGFGIFP